MICVQKRDKKSALSRITHFMELPKRQAKEAILNESIFHISVQLLPSSLICLRKINSNMINHVLERCLRIII